jgi:hypothetical protein
VKYTEYGFLYPPRPENAIMKMALSAYDARKWHAQIKKNGTNNVIAVSPEKELICMTRHGVPHKQWAPTTESAEPFKALPGKGWYVFVAELMNNKTPDIKDINYVNDVLVADGEYLVGVTFSERQLLIESLFNVHAGESAESHWIAHPNLWVAKSFKGVNFRTLFEELHKPEDEGLVIKNPNAKLLLCNTQSANSGWMVKIRKKTKNYGF